MRPSHGRKHRSSTTPKHRCFPLASDRACVRSLAKPKHNPFRTPSRASLPPSCAPASRISHTSPTIRRHPRTPRATMTWVTHFAVASRPHRSWNHACRSRRPRDKNSASNGRASTPSNNGFHRSYERPHGPFPPIVVAPSCDWKSAPGPCEEPSCSFERTPTPSTSSLMLHPVSIWRPGRIVPVVASHLTDSP